jgi:hypothetical protein
VLARSLGRVAGHAARAGCEAGLGGVVAGLGGVVAVGVVVGAASGPGGTDAAGARGTAGVAAGATAGFAGEAHAPARRAMPSAAATAVRFGLKAMTRHGNKRGDPAPLSFC